MTSVKDRIVERNRYQPSPEQLRKAKRLRVGHFTMKKVGDLFFDEKGRCFEQTRNGAVERR